MFRLCAEHAVIPKRTRVPWESIVARACEERENSFAKCCSAPLFKLAARDNAPGIYISTAGHRDDRDDTLFFCQRGNWFFYANAGLRAYVRNALILPFPYWQR